MVVMAMVTKCSGLEKKKEKKQKAQGKGISVWSFLVYAKDTVDGMSGLGLIAIL